MACTSAQAKGDVNNSSLSKSNQSDPFKITKTKNAKKRETRQDRRYAMDYEFKYFEEARKNILARLKTVYYTKLYEFDKYMSQEQVQLGLNNGTLIVGRLRINNRCFNESYVSNSDPNKLDYLIETLKDRNRALDGDVVVIQLLNIYQNEQQTAKVVHILEKVQPRVAVGYFNPVKKNKIENSFALLSPRDSRKPRIRVKLASFPSDFLTHFERYGNVLYLVEIQTWTDVRFANGRVLKKIGDDSDIRNETQSILLENSLDVTPYGDDIIKIVNKLERIPQLERMYRQDLTSECIFTIDPSTAKDLDDAMSLKRLPNGNFLVGVHISDVDFYMPKEVDQIAAKKATTVYLVDKTYHMLPKELCNVCSLLPGEDKLTFSVFWEMTDDAKIVNERIVKTIIRSCVQLSYEHAQYMLDNNALDESVLPELKEHNYSKISQIIRDLNAIAKKIRARRYENGALRIDQPKLVFQLDPDTMLPLNFTRYEHKESNSLIEEFMLLANMTVAKKLHDEYPDKAFLRRHEPPIKHMLHAFTKMMETVGIYLDDSSAGALQKSLTKYTSGASDQSNARSLVLNSMCAKAMKRAEYFCVDTVDSVRDYMHYALNVPMYTHFTSPIRRYADCLVHRMLAACLGYSKPCNLRAPELREFAMNCNRQKYNAKVAGDQSSQLYLAKYIEMFGPLITKAVVIDVKGNHFDCICLNMGNIVRINLDKSSNPVVVKKENFDETNEGSHSKKLGSMVIAWNNNQREQLQVVEIFTIVWLSLTANKLKIVGQLVQGDVLS